MNNSSYYPFEIAQKRFDSAAEMLDLDQATRDLLRSPMREHLDKVIKVIINLFCCRFVTNAKSHFN